jgi:hypothetical protein
MAGSHEEGSLESMGRSSPATRCRGARLREGRTSPGTRWGRGGAIWRRSAARCEGGARGGEAVTYPSSPNGFVGGGETGQAVPQGNVHVLSASITGGANSNGRADWVATRAAEEHKLGGATAHPRGTARYGSAAISSARDP